MSRTTEKKAPKTKKSAIPTPDKPTLTPLSPKPPKNAWLGTIALVLIGGAIYQASLPYWSEKTIEITNKDTPISQILSGYTRQVYSEIVIDGNTLLAKYPAKQAFHTGSSKVREQIIVDSATLPKWDSLSELGLSDITNATKVTIKDLSTSNLLKEVLSYVLMAVIFLFLAFFLMAKMGGVMQGGPMAFIRSKARMYDPLSGDKITFADVAGSDEEKDDLSELVGFLKEPEKYDKLGAKIPRGVLMVGPPGTGKTLLARAVAGEAGVPFFSVSGSEFVEMFVGVGASRVRSLFEEAKAKAPAIIFIDEVDAIGKRRGPGMGGGHDEREQTLNQILTEMDGFDNQTHIIVLAATNRADVLDKALLRPGRFDRKVTINLPNLADREKILVVHAKNKPLAADVNLQKIAQATVGLSGAELANLLNESAILAGKQGASELTHAMIQASIEKVALGNTKKSSRMTDLEKKMTSYHEVGHAILHHVLPHIDPVYKVSIIPRGPTGGVTWYLPEKDSTFISKRKFYESIMSLYGGRLAEEIYFGKDQVTTGASNDIQRATEIARNMILRYGFDDDLGAEFFESALPEGNYLGADAGMKQLSDDTLKVIDLKVRTLLKNAYEDARKVLLQYADIHHTIAESLLVKEELLADEFKAFFVDQEVPPKALV